jgi:hypothetical protein
MTEVEAVVNWVSQGNARKRKTINRKVSSYGLKNVVERDTGRYVGNDSFIEAMDTLGFKKKQIEGTSNYFFDIHLEKNHD